MTLPKCKNDDMSHPKGKLNTREKLKYFMLLILLVVMLNFLKLKMKSDVQLRQPRLTALIMMKQLSGLYKTLLKWSKMNWT